MSRPRPWFRQRRRRAPVLAVGLLLATAVAVASVLAFAAGGQAPSPDTAPDTAAPSSESPIRPGGPAPRDERADREQMLRPHDSAARETPFYRGSSGSGEPDTAGTTPEEEPRSEPRDLPPHLVDHLEGLLAEDDITDIEELSVAVLDPDGHLVAGHEPERAVVPASTQKLVTSAAALRELGPEHEFTTRAVATGPIIDGTLEGDLVIVGEGDPTLASEPFRDEVHPQRPHTPIEPLTEAVEEAGVDTIEGSVLGDPSFFADEPEPGGWRERYFHSLDTTRSSGLTIDAGRELEERDGRLLGAAAEDPALTTAEVVTELLDDADIDVDGDPGRAPSEDGHTHPEAEELGAVHSPPLGELLEVVMQESDNHLADATFRTLGAHDGNPTWGGSDDAVREALRDLDPSWGDAVLADGSGLSRDDRLSALLLAELDHAVTAEHDEFWRETHAVAGESGTLRRRLTGTAAEGNVFAKTGTLRDSRALAGHVDSRDGDRYHFAILGGDLDGPGIQAVRRLQDDLALVLADPPDCEPADHPGTCDPPEDDESDDGENDDGENDDGADG
ncbi:hypothetical protein ER308_07580 [Egibacter rhizosphaerae]|uniref:Serine-type D-Ala-D-Ala carboxypeptidase n=1 Tax=Egibacter rhizosphaerae TaxID=1670831 RepID=A0A411YE16_9ACTN|nr:D-alanyl-D-alanine carboxypeptidase [Egibacter rhizosphaerae]QBI19426.1 hypothetical protein ER308_07580 [Egibacter rhizosphaerae]